MASPRFLAGSGFIDLTGSNPTIRFRATTGSDGTTPRVGSGNLMIEILGPSTRTGAITASGLTASNVIAVHGGTPTVLTINIGSDQGITGVLGTARNEVVFGAVTVNLPLIPGTTSSVDTAARIRTTLSGNASLTAIAIVGGTGTTITVTSRTNGPVQAHAQYYTGAFFQQRRTFAGVPGNADSDSGADFLMNIPANRVGEIYDVFNHGDSLSIIFIDSDVIEDSNGVALPAGSSFVTSPGHITDENRLLGTGPAIVGTPAIGVTVMLDVTGINDPDGEPANFDYQWLLNGQNAPGSSSGMIPSTSTAGADYRITAAGALSCRVTWTDAHTGELNTLETDPVNVLVQSYQGGGTPGRSDRSLARGGTRYSTLMGERDANEKPLKSI